MLIFCLFPCLSYSVSFSYFGACSNQPLVKLDIENQKFPISVGQLSVEVLEQNNIEYKGGSSGFSSIMGSPAGSDAIEVVSDVMMRAHGLCFSINGEAPDAMPDQILLHANTDKIVWWVGYATYNRGQWSDYCRPTYLIAPAQFCHKSTLSE